MLHTHTILYAITWAILIQLLTDMQYDSPKGTSSLHLPLADDVLALT